MVNQKEKYKLSDGRTISYVEFGDKNGVPVFYAHGCPSSCLDAQIFHEEALRCNFRIIATDRPGMGESSNMEKRCLLDYPRDIEKLANGLSIDKFGVIGWSGGGAFTIACAYALADRLLFNITLAGYVNFFELTNARDLFKSKLDQVSIAFAMKYPSLFTLMFGAMNLFQKALPRLFYRIFVSGLCLNDREIAKNLTFRKMLIESLTDSFRQGSEGVRKDTLIHYADWEFRLEDINFKLHVFHGTEDTLVPIEFSLFIKKRSKNCYIHVLDQEGHFFPFKYQKQIFDIANSEVRSSLLKS